MLLSCGSSCQGPSKYNVFSAIEIIETSLLLCCTSQDVFETRYYCLSSITHNIDYRYTGTRLNQVSQHVLTRIEPTQIRHLGIWTLQSGRPTLFFVAFSEQDLVPTPVQMQVRGAEV